MFKRLCLVIAIAGAVAASGCGAPIEEADGAPREIRIVADENGFTPGEITVRADAPTVLEFVRTTDKTCNTSVVFTESGITRELPLDEPVRITVAPKDGQRLAFTCPMEMGTGVIVGKKGAGA